MKIRKDLADKAVKHILAHPAFSAVKEDALRYILSSDDVLLREIPKGQQLYPCHGVKKCIGLVLTGSCHVLREGRITESKADGFVFGEQSLYSSAADDFTLAASQDSKIVIIKKSAVDWLFHDDYSAVKGFISYLSDIICSKDKTEDAVIPEKTLAAYLLGRPKNSKGEIELPTDLLKLAKQLRLGKDGLYKAIEKLNSAGAIQFNGRAVCISDEELLRNFDEQ